MQSGGSWSPIGVFERIFIAYQAKQIDVEIFENLYGYRLGNIWANKRIVDGKLENNSLSGRQPLKMSYKRLIALTWVVEAHNEERFPLHTDTYFPADLFGWWSARKIRKKVPPPRVDRTRTAP
jgi:hypothetical protein